jgi:hypothetical protein
MKRMLLTLVATLGAAGILAPPAGSSGWTTERYYANEVWRSFADVGKANPSSGGPADLYVSQLRLTTLDGRRAGIANGYSVELRRPYVFGHWTSSVAQGTLSLEGAMSQAPTAGPQRLAIVGGSGRYEGAHGTVTVTDAGPDRSLAVVRFAR